MMELTPPTASWLSLFSFFEQDWNLTLVLSQGRGVGRATQTTLLLKQSTLLGNHVCPTNPLKTRNKISSEFRRSSRLKRWKQLLSSFKPGGE